MTNAACVLCGAAGREVAQDADLVPRCDLLSTDSHPFGETWQEQIAARARCAVVFGCEPDEAVIHGVESARDAGYPMPPKPLPPIPGETRIERIKRTVSIVDLASNLTRLSRGGRGKLRGLCPLHNERTPSFYVWPDQGRWHCFGACGRGGDVIDLWQLARGRMPDE